ncbi:MULTISPECIES: CDP-alcohol phosphatidyltransferase family protein [unclassified Microbacterium]|uniref:CDP-alcohol phosphatidyltransferase family protein n=1 Tax=unclassified Microbacterium TaxID=2609290 RepID=UPI0034129C39
MLDRSVRAALSRPLDAITAAIDRPGVTPDRITMLGLVLGVASAVAAALHLWWVALVLWLVSRIADGLDGTLARRRRALAGPGADAGGPGDDARGSEAGGFLDITADFVVYGATVMGVAIGATSEFDAPWWPFLAVLFAYYVNGTAFLAFSSIAERTGRTIDDGRSLSFLGRIAEGTETIVVHSVWLILPFWSWQIAIGWCVFVSVSAVQRIVVGYRSLR